MAMTEKDNKVTLAPEIASMGYFYTPQICLTLSNSTHKLDSILFVAYYLS
jgi:hypothetical protein